MEKKKSPTPWQCRKGVASTERVSFLYISSPSPFSPSDQSIKNHDSRIASANKEDDILLPIAGLDLAELATRVRALGPVNGRVAAVGDGDVCALEGVSVDGTEVVPDGVINEVVREDLLGGAVEDAVVLCGDLDGDAARGGVCVELLGPGLACVGSRVSGVWLGWGLDRVRAYQAQRSASR